MIKINAKNDKTKIEDTIKTFTNHNTSVFYCFVFFTYNETLVVDIAIEVSRSTSILTQVLLETRRCEWGRIYNVQL